jgi:hypothetical protein
MNLLHDLVSTNSASSSLTQLEVILFKANLYGKLEAPIQTKVEPKKKDFKTDEVDQAETIEEKVTKPVLEENIQKKVVEAEEVSVVTKTSLNPSEPIDWWQDVLMKIKKINNTLYGILRMAEPNLDKDTLTLSFVFGFHAKKVADSNSLTKLRDAIKDVTGKSFTINSVHNPELAKKTKKETKPKAVQKPINEEEINAVTNIFGGGEVLES